MPDERCVGRRATPVFERVVEVKDSSPVHGRMKLWETEFQVRVREQEFAVPRPRLARGFDYVGQHIDIRLESKLTVDDGVLFDTTVEGVHQLGVLDRPRLDGRAKDLVEPADAFEFLTNLNAIPRHSQLITIGLLVVGGLVVVVNALVGLHDQGGEGVTVEMAATAIREGRALSPDSAGRLWTLERVSSNGLSGPMFHRQSRMFVTYIRGRDPATFRRFLEALLDERELTGPFRTHLGMGTAEIWEEFVASLRS